MATFWLDQNKIGHETTKLMGSHLLDALICSLPLISSIHSRKHVMSADFGWRWRWWQAGDAKDWVYTTHLHVHYNVDVPSSTFTDFWPSGDATVSVYGVTTIDI